MKRTKLLAVIVLSSSVPLLTAPPKQEVLVIHRPTIIAFFPPVTEANLDKDPDTNETLADFQLYAARVRQPLQEAGIDFHEIYAHSFRTKTGTTVQTFRPGKVKVGYYLVAPGKKPRIEYGVNTDVGLLEVASEYFGIAIKPVD